MVRRKSEVWKHFSKNGQSATCNMCNVVVANCHNTSNMWAHLNNRHGILNPNSKSNNATIRQGCAPARRSLEENNSEQEDEPSNENSGNVGTAAAGAGDNANDSAASAGRAPLAALLRKRRSSENTTGAPAPKQMTLQASIGRASSFQEGGERDATQRDALLFMMMKENMPLSTPDSEGFLYYNSKTTPLWKPPSRQTMTRLMEAKYMITADLVKSALSELPAVCLTADSWTDSHTTKSYLGTTVHFVLDSAMETACIGVMRLEERHTGVYLAEKLLQTCEMWGITPERVSMVVVDNAENIKLAVKTAFGENKLLHCFDHTLNLIPKYALGFKSDNNNTPHVPGVPELVKKMKAIVTFSHTSSNFANELSRIQIEQFNRTEGTVLRLSQDVRTRWGSTFKMIDRFLNLSDVICQAAAKFPEVTMLTAAELATMRTVMDVLRPFHEATTEMGAERHTTSSKVIPTVHLITKAVQNIICSEQDKIGKAFKDFCLSEIKRRFEHIEKNKPLAMATMLDPRFIKAYFQGPMTTANTMTLLEMEVRQLMREGAAACARAVHDADPPLEPAPAPAAGQNQSLWASHAELARSANAATATDDVAARAKAEIRAYISRELLPITADPLKSWEAIKPLYPNLYIVAQKYLSILATSLPSERLFSKLSFISTEETSRLTAEHLSQRVFLASIEKDMWEAARVPK